MVRRFLVMLPVISARLACIAGFFRVQDLGALDFFIVPTYRTHSALEMDCPLPRPVQPPKRSTVWKVPEVGGLHHHDERRAA